MRISDWSSDVVSSDLRSVHEDVVRADAPRVASARERAGHREGDRVLARDLVFFQQARRRTTGARPAACRRAGPEPGGTDRKSVVPGKSGSVRVDHGGRRIIKKNNKKT